MGLGLGLGLWQGLGLGLGLDYRIISYNDMQTRRLFSDPKLHDLE